MKRLNKTSVITAVVSATAVGVLCLAVWPYIPHTTDPSISPSSDTDSETRPTVDRWYLQTAPNEWISVNDELCWNDQLVFKVENLHVSESCPADLPKEDLTRNFAAVQSDQPIAPQIEAIAAENNSLFLDLTLEVSCIDIKPVSFFGLPETDADYHFVTNGSMELSVYEYDSGRLYQANNRSYEDGLFAFQDLSGNQPIYDGLPGAYELHKGESCRMRLVYMVAEDYWNEQALLLTPEYASYDTEQLLWADYDQPHFHLNADKGE